MRQISARVDDELFAAIEATRGDVPRERWMRTALKRETDRAASNGRGLEAALSEAKGARLATQAGPAPVPSPEGVRPAASPRARGHKDEPVDLMVALKASLDTTAGKQHRPNCKCPVCKPAKAGK